MRVFLLTIVCWTWAFSSRAEHLEFGRPVARWARPRLDAVLERALLWARVGRCRRAQALLGTVPPVPLDRRRLAKLVNVAWLCGRPRSAARWLRRLTFPPVVELEGAGPAGHAWAWAAEGAGWWRWAAAWYLAAGRGSASRRISPAVRARLLARGLELLLAHGRVDAVVGHLGRLPAPVWQWPEVDLVAATALLASGRVAAGTSFVGRVCSQVSSRWLGGLRGLGSGCRGFYAWLVATGCGCRPLPRPTACVYERALAGRVRRAARAQPICRALASARGSGR